MGQQAEFECSVTPHAFVCEVDRFCEAALDPALSPEDKKRAFGLVVRHAGMLNPLHCGFEGAGVALKHAVCVWLGLQAPSHQAS